MRPNRPSCRAVIIKNHPRWRKVMDVTILLGSSSDLPIAQKCTKILEHFDVPYQLRVASAHRSPRFVEQIVGDAIDDGCSVFIAMAGLAAALPGAVAALTTKPVIGVPCGGKVPFDSLLSIAQLLQASPLLRLVLTEVTTLGTLRCKCWRWPIQNTQLLLNRTNWIKSSA